jgi:hypothetical protein
MKRERFILNVTVYSLTAEEVKFIKKEHLLNDIFPKLELKDDGSAEFWVKGPLGLSGNVDAGLLEIGLEAYGFEIVDKK